MSWPVSWWYFLTSLISEGICLLQADLSYILLAPPPLSPTSTWLRLHNCPHMQNTTTMIKKQIKSPGDIFWQIWSWNLFTSGWPLICSAPASPHPHPHFSLRAGSTLSPFYLFHFQCNLHRNYIDWRTAEFLVFAFVTQTPLPHLPISLLNRTPSLFFSLSVVYSKTIGL